MARVITHASLFSGIGAPELAAMWMGWNNLFHCEINDFCRTILQYWYPNSVSYEDIKTTNFEEWRGRVDVLTGGFPCQPFSAAGRRKGTADDRYLWPAMLRVIGQVQPTFVIAENVDGILSMVQPGRTTELEGSPDLFGAGNHVYRIEERYVADLVCADLEKAGYSAQPIVIPACGVGAPHRRYRVWFVAQRRGDRYSPHPRDTGVESMQEWQTAVHAAEPATHAARSGDFTHKTNSPIERERWKDDGQQNQRREPTQWTDGLPSFSRPLADTECGRGDELDTNLQPQQSDGAWIDGTGGQRPTAFANEQGRVPRRTEHAGTEESQPAKGQLGRADCPQDWWRSFPSVSPVCDRDDGLSVGIPSLTIPFGEWRKNAITALGNSMVPQVVMELFRAIKIELDRMSR